jgi:hypothetical protein
VAPELRTLIGAAVIIASGLALLHHETRGGAAHPGA